MRATLTAEGLKLSSTRGPWIAAVVFLVLSFGFGLANAVIVNDPGNDFTISNAGATAGVRGFGIMVLMVLAVVSVTQEYANGTIRLTFQATPVRHRVMVAKGLVLGGLAAAAAVATAAVSIPLAGLVADPSRQSDLGLAHATGVLLGVGVVSGAAALLALGIGALLRSGTAAVALVIMWPAVFEALVAQMPRFGAVLAPYLPFGNAELGMTGRTGDLAYPWGQTGALAYFTVLCLVVFAAGVVAVGRRDA